MNKWHEIREIIINEIHGNIFSLNQYCDIC